MFPRIGFSRWLIWGMILALLLISGCAAPATPTPTNTPTPTPAPTLIPTYTPTSTATATLEPTPNPTEIAAQATATAQAEQAIQAQAEIKHLQQAFEQLAEKYPEGYSGENLQANYQFVNEVETRGVAGLALWPTYRQLIQDLDPEGKILFPEEIEQFLKENPDESLVIAFRGKNIVYYPQKDNPGSAKFYPDWAEWFAVFSYDRNSDEIKIATKPVPLNEGGHSVLRFRVAAPWTFLGGTLPTKREEQNRRWAEWQIEGYIMTADGELIPVGGFIGHTKEDKNMWNGSVSLKGWAKPVAPEDSVLLQDVDVVSLLNGEQN